MRTIVNALLVCDCTVLLARRSAHRRAYPDCWSFPGGHVEDGESREAALSRELSEEVGVFPVEYYFLDTIKESTGTADPATFHLYVVHKWTGNPAIQDDEHTELRWFSLVEAGSLPDLALENYRTLFADLQEKLSSTI